MKDVGSRTQQVKDSEGSVVLKEENVSLVVGLNETCHAEASAVAKIADAHNGEVIGTVLSGEDQCAMVVEMSASSVSSFTEDLRQAGLVSYVEPRGKSQTQFWPDDQYFSAQWGVQKIEADWAWNVSVGSHDVLVAVLDSGIDWHHPDLVSNYVPLGYDWVNDDADPMDDYGHGTHCAGTIAATMNNSQGVAGMAQVRVMAEKVLNNRGEGYSDWIANGLYHAVQQGARVISMSFGDYDGNEVVHEAIKYAYSAGVFLVACAGNGNTDAKFYPAAYPEVIAVTATGSDDVKASFSNFGDWVELAAPGVGVLSTLPNNDYQSYSGTSVACPFVSGLCALIFSAFPNSTASFARYLLWYAADDFGDPGFDEYYGYGRINARKALGSPSAEHEIVAFDLATPPYLRLGVSNIMTAEIFNLGKNNENNIVVQLFANDSLVWNHTLASLPSYGSASVNIDWVPTTEGTYNITLYTVPFLGEAILENNALTKFIYVGSAIKAVVVRSSSSMSEDVIKNWNAL
ncbi:S8 family serine peptidase, partial [Candidatus Bathyarchaeota archaeon]|nr:S8 family serine peptidase [Candidatus Bathyarchaeota archaeon]